MKRLLCVLAVVAFAALGLHGAFMMPMDHAHGAFPMSHIEPTEPACPMGFVCPLASVNFGDAMVLPAPTVMALVLVLIVTATGLLGVSNPYRPPLFVFANAGPPVILKTIKRE